MTHDAQRQQEEGPDHSSLPDRSGGTGETDGTGKVHEPGNAGKEGKEEGMIRHSAASPIRHAPIRVQAHDKFFLLFEGLGAPVTCMWFFLFEDLRLERDRWIKALQRTFQRHPKAGSRLVRRGRGLGKRLFWELVTDAAQRASIFHNAQSPLASLDSEDSIASEILNIPFDPEEGPLVQFHWIQRQDKPNALGFRFHHSLGDGYGSLIFIRDLLATYHGGSPPGPDPDYAAEPMPQVRGNFFRRLKLFGRLLAFHFRRSSAYRFAPPDTLFDPWKKPGGRIAIKSRAFSGEAPRRYLQGAKARGASFNDLVLSAWGVAINRWKEDRGLKRGTLRVMVNQNLRRPEDGAYLVENRSSAFPVWMAPEECQDGHELLQRVHLQTRECRELDIAEATVLLGAPLKLPLSWAKKLVLPAATKPLLSDSFVVSNMGRLASAPLGTKTWIPLKEGRLVGGLVTVRPPDGVGIICTVLTAGSELRLTVLYLDQLFTPEEVASLLDQMERALEEIAAGPETGTSP